MGEGQETLCTAGRSRGGRAQRLLAGLGGLGLGRIAGGVWRYGSGVAVGRAARNSARGKWNVRNPRRRCRKLAVGYRQRDIALPHDAREKRSTEPSCT